MNTKTSITVLHELLQAKKLPLPTYTVEDAPGGQFRCKVRASGVKAEAIGTSKKIAKQDACKIILAKLQTNQNSQPKSKVQVPLEKQNLTKKPQNGLDTQPGSRNYVGELNEYSSKRHVEFPVYECLPSTLKTGEYITNCSFMGYQALGKGKSMKEAKQDSARNMLKLYLNENTETKSVGCAVKKVKNKKGKSEAKPKKVLHNELTQDLQKIVNTVNNLSLIQQPSSDNRNHHKMQIIINLES